MRKQQNLKEQFLAVFLKEWEIFNPKERVELDKTSVSERGDFDTPLNVGELRLFAESKTQFVGLLYKKIDDGWIIVPTSMFTVPATEEEIVIGDRVYQLWNTFTASSSFAVKSWFVDTVADNDRKDLYEALLYVMVGDPLREDLQHCIGLPITSIDDPRLGYEQTFATGLMFNSFRGEEDVHKEDEYIKVGILDQLFDKYLRTSSVAALAAATDDLNPHVPVLMHKGAWDAMMEGQEVSGFSGYSPLGDGPTGLTFYLCGDIPEEFDGENELSVSAYKRETRELVGKGRLKRLEDGRCRISIRLGEGCEPVDVQEAGELVLIAE